MTSKRPVVADLGIVWLSLVVARICAQSPITVQELFFGGTNSSSSHIPNNNRAYIEWINATGSFYDHAIFVPVSSTSNNGAAIHWRILHGRIYVAVAARAKGWVGFGLAEAGGMKGADIVYYTVSTNELVDAHVLDDFQSGPIVDECQNWELRDSQSSGGFVIFEAVRDLDTFDTQDRPIIDDSDAGSVPVHRIIAAWGGSEEISYHGTSYQIRSSLRFHGKPDDRAAFYEAVHAQAEGSFELRASNYTLKAKETEYKYFCFSREALVALGAPADQPIHGIAWEPFVDPDAAPYVHHMNVYGSQKANTGMPYTGITCQYGFTNQLVYVWTPGMDPIALPENVGAPYMDTEGFNSFMLEIHYNNPHLLPNITDTTGVRFYFTTKLRPNNLFYYVYGDPTIEFYGLLVGDHPAAAVATPVVATDASSPLATTTTTSVAAANSRWFQHSFTCPSHCSSLALTEPVTVVREYLHMHQTGLRIQSLHMRNGTVIRTGFTDFWDFAQQGHHAVMQQPFQVLPGDTFQAHCYYEPKNTTRFGFATNEEMCVAYLLFYRPRTHGVPQRDTCVNDVNDRPCRENHTQQALTSLSQLHRVFGAPPKICTANTTTTTTRLVHNNTPSRDGKKTISTGAWSETSTFRVFSQVAQIMGLIGAAILLLCNLSLLRCCRGSQIVSAHPKIDQ